MMGNVVAKAGPQLPVCWGLFENSCPHVERPGIRTMSATIWEFGALMGVSAPKSPSPGWFTPMSPDPIVNPLVMMFPSAAKRTYVFKSWLGPAATASRAARIAPIVRTKVDFFSVTVSL
jgi:hypothetical protein